MLIVLRTVYETSDRLKAIKSIYFIKYYTLTFRTIIALLNHPTHYSFLVSPVKVQIKQENKDDQFRHHDS